MEEKSKFVECLESLLGFGTLTLYAEGKRLIKMRLLSLYLEGIRVLRKTCLVLVALLVSVVFLTAGTFIVVVNGYDQYIQTGTVDFLNPVLAFGVILTLTSVLAFFWNFRERRWVVALGLQRVLREFSNESQARNEQSRKGLKGSNGSKDPNYEDLYEMIVALVEAKVRSGKAKASNSSTDEKSRVLH